MTLEPNPRPLRKDRLAPAAGHPDPPSGALRLAELATIAYSSEDPSHPVEHLLDRVLRPG